MKRILQWIALGAAVLSLNSCGLPAAIIRSAGNLVQTAASVAGGGS